MTSIPIITPGDRGYISIPQFVWERVISVILIRASGELPIIGMDEREAVNVWVLNLDEILGWVHQVDGIGELEFWEGGGER